MCDFILSLFFIGIRDFSLTGMESVCGRDLARRHDPKID